MLHAWSIDPKGVFVIAYFGCTIVIYVAMIAIWYIGGRGWYAHRLETMARSAIIT